MFKKIDCVMIRVDDVAAGERFYSEVFGLKPLWREAGSVGMGMPETDAELCGEPKTFGSDTNG